MMGKYLARFRTRGPEMTEKRTNTISQNKIRGKGTSTVHQLASKTMEGIMNAQQESMKLMDTADLLKRADRCIKQGNYTAALDLIQKARTVNPSHLYALAFEERVKALMRSDCNNGNDKECAAPQKKEDKVFVETKPIVTPVSQRIPMPEPDPDPEPVTETEPARTVRENPAPAAPTPIIPMRNTPVSVREIPAQSPAPPLPMPQAIERRTEAVLLDRRIEEYLILAERHRQGNDHNNALNEIARIYMLDPANARAAALERKIREAMTAPAVRSEPPVPQPAERANAETVHADLQEELSREKDRTRASIHQRVREYIEQALHLLDKQKFDEALNELSLAVVLDPFNPDIKLTERKIAEAQEQYWQRQIAMYRKEFDERRQRREDIVAVIREQLHHAEELVGQHKYADALRTVASMAVLGKVHDDLFTLEQKKIAIH